MSTFPLRSFRVTPQQCSLEHSHNDSTINTGIGIIMAALCNMEGHYIFALWFLSIYLLSFFSSSNLSGRRLDVYHTHGVAPVLVLIYTKCIIYKFNIYCMNVPTLHTAEATSFFSVLCPSQRNFTYVSPTGILTPVKKTIIKNTKTVNKECTTENVISLRQRQMTSCRQCEMEAEISDESRKKTTSSQCTTIS